mgnify:CR=1 FL=1
MMPRIAIVGSGISGLSAAHHLKGHAEVTLFEAGDYFGGHTHTVDVTLPTATGVQTHGVDTGFLVYNERTYPGLIALFDDLQVATAKSDMSFSVQVPRDNGQGALEWNGANLNTVFAQRSNLFRPSFLRMLRDVIRFNTLATALAERNEDHELAQPLSGFLFSHKFSEAFRDWYLLPMVACIWSCPTAQMLQFPIRTLIRFCHNHGLLQITDRPTWMTVAGGSKNYVSTLANAIQSRGGKIEKNAVIQTISRNNNAVSIRSSNGVIEYDHIVLACHSDQALALLGDNATPEERTHLGKIRYQPNRAVLHSDSSLLPKRNNVWSAWNYASPGVSISDGRASPPVAVSYLLNRLQPLPTAKPIIVSLNPWREPEHKTVYREINYAHPVFDAAAIAAQSSINAISGTNRTFYAGAWLGYGFHEDGFASAVRAAGRLAPLPEWLVAAQPTLNVVDIADAQQAQAVPA